LFLVMVKSIMKWNWSGLPHTFSIVAEHVLMSILVLIKNFVPAHTQITNGEWNVANVGELSSYEE
jgi:lactate dehydrogenase-like 2-hydroxyacid dehydrogenase